MNYKKYLWVIIVILLLLMAIAGWYFWPKTDSPYSASLEKPIDLNQINTAKVQTITVPDIYKAVGTIKPSIESNLEAKISARILKVNVVPGQQVKAKELLIILDSRDFQARVERAEQAIQVATTIHDQAKISYDRLSNLVKPGYVSVAQFDRAKSDYLTAIARLKQAEKFLKEAEIELSYCEIKAPAAGIILDKYVHPGDQATPGKVLLKLQMTKLLQLKTNVPEEFIHKIKIGQKLKVSIDAINQGFSSTVVEIVPNIDPQTRTFTVKVNLPLISTIFPGMFGRLLIPIQTKQILVIPKKAIIEQGQLQFVKIIQNNKIHKVIITTGKEYNEKIQVLSGINTDEIIIVPNL